MVGVVGRKTFLIKKTKKLFQKSFLNNYFEAMYSVCKAGTNTEE